MKELEDLYSRSDVKKKKTEEIRMGVCEFQVYGGEQVNIVDGKENIYSYIYTYTCTCMYMHMHSCIHTCKPETIILLPYFNH